MEKSIKAMSRTELQQWVNELEEKMHAAAKHLAFEEAAKFRDILLEAKLLLEK
jgi:excinuclease UvrABC helicase subunit UvrB